MSVDLCVFYRYDNYIMNSSSRNLVLLALIITLSKGQLRGLNE